jgi:hypothetical protein
VRTEPGARLRALLLRLEAWLHETRHCGRVIGSRTVRQMWSPSSRGKQIDVLKIQRQISTGQLDRRTPSLSVALLTSFTTRLSRAKRLHEDMLHREALNDWFRGPRFVEQKTTCTEFDPLGSPLLLHKSDPAGVWSQRNRSRDLTLAGRPRTSYRSFGPLGRSSA